jgi:hypothetical protein
MSSFRRLTPFYSFVLLQFSFSLTVKVKVTLRLTISQLVSLGVQPHLRLMTRCLLLLDSYGLLCGALSDERTGLSFVYAAGPRQRSLSRFRVPSKSKLCHDRRFSRPVRLGIKHPWEKPEVSTSSLTAHMEFCVTQPRGGPHGKHFINNVCLLARYPAKDILYCRVLLYTLPSNALFSKNLSPREVFIEPLPSSGSIRHSIIFYDN